MDTATLTLKRFQVKLKRGLSAVIEFK